MFSQVWTVKKIWLVFLLLLAACGDSQGALTETQPQRGSLQGHIFLWKELPIGISETQSDEIQQVIKSRLKEFTQLNPGVKITLKSIPSKESIAPFIKESERGAGPNLLWLTYTTEIPKLIDSGRLQVLDKYPAALSSFRPEALQQVHYQGQLYGIPTNLETQVLCYNRDKVKQVPNTLSELVDQARAGYSVGLHSGFAEAFWGAGIFHGRLFDERNRFRSTSGKSWVQWMEWLKEARYEPNFFLIDEAEELQQLFVQKKLAYITCLSGWIPFLREALGQNSLGIALLPHGTNRPATPPLLTDVLLFNSASSPDQTRLALKLAEFLTNAEQQKKTQLALPSSIPVNINVTADRRLYPFQAILYEQSRSGAVLSLAQSGQLGSKLDYLDSLYQQFLGGEIAPAEAAAELTRIVSGSGEGSKEKADE